MEKNWVSFQTVKEAVSMEMVLAHYGVTLRRVNATSLRGKCPLPSHSSASSKQSFAVQVARNVWACWSASCVAARGGRGGNVLDFVAAMENCSIREAALRLQAWFLTGLPRQAARTDIRDGRTIDDLVTVNQPLSFTLKGVDASHPYLAKRGIAQETAAYFGVGFYQGKGSMSSRVVIPIHNAQGELIAYAGRAIDSARPRYKLPANFQKSHVLFNLHRACASKSSLVVVVEGFFDCLKVHQAGFPCVVALMGAWLSEAQEELLASDFHLAVLMLDGDQAGIDACCKIAPRLARHLPIRIVEVPSGRQPDQLSSDQIRRILGSL